MINIQQIDLDGQHILYDAGRQSNIDLNWFDPIFWRARQSVTGFAQGRASTLFFLWQNQEHVLRHYHRGGVVGNFIRDQYLWTGLNRTRAWREWHLLARLIELDLPVPVPVAARIQRNGLCYRADLITERITDTESLADTLTQSALSDQVWEQLGIVIAKFHRAGVDHADLNAHNILLHDSQVYLIDFDRGRIRNRACCWQQKNLRRLLRSLKKLKKAREHFHFIDENWLTLLRGYSEQDAH
ncbi:MAG: 3-deoxy-D-manno-octulosonic acid kinase [Gammaproteobacteria bacterium]|nr:3-deoxy-D-manno-octulosonic acid kinase [Gammaproteobacteria bacterium]